MAVELDSQTERLLRQSAAGRVVFLTGAGLSADSGIPTFRGPEGYWKVGTQEYFPEELATLAAFKRHRQVCWGWYLYRRAVCRRAVPNHAHAAIARLDSLGDRFTLVTQNVDGLHGRAGSAPERTYEIHGNIDRYRCFDDCTTDRYPIPDSVSLEWAKERVLDELTDSVLRCPRCGAPGRPHVLWFDECYDEPRFRFESSRAAAADADLLVVVGTAGATNLPNQVVQLAAARGAAVIAVNLDPSPFTELAARLPKGVALIGRASEWVPTLVERILAFQPVEAR